AGYRSPTGFARSDVRPSFVAAEQTLYAGDVRMDQKPGMRGDVLVSGAVGPEGRGEVLKTSLDVVVGREGSLVSWQSRVGLARDLGKRQVPSEAKGSVAGTGIVGKRQLRTEPGPSRRHGKRQGHRSGANNRVSGELLSDSAYGSAALWNGYSWRRP